MITTELLQEHMDVFGKHRGFIAKNGGKEYGIVTNYDHDDRFFHWVITLIPSKLKASSYTMLLMKATGGAHEDHLSISESYYNQGDIITFFDKTYDSDPKKYQKEMEDAAELIRIYKEADYWPFRKETTDDVIDILNLPQEERWVYIEEKQKEFKGVDLNDAKDTIHRPLLSALKYQKNVDETILNELIETMERQLHCFGISKSMHDYLTYSIGTLKEIKEEMK